MLLHFQTVVHRKEYKFSAIKDLMIYACLESQEK